MPPNLMNYYASDYKLVRRLLRRQQLLPRSLNLITSRQANLLNDETSTTKIMDHLNISSK